MREMTLSEGGFYSTQDDDDVRTSWNGLMLAAVAGAARVLEGKDYQDSAERNAGFLP